MKCAVCGLEAKRFTMFPSKRRAEFVEHLCQKCTTNRRYDELRLEQAKKSTAIPCK